MTKPTNKLKILFWDMETTYLEARVWRLGEQSVRHDQLKDERDSYDIICITYCWNDGKPAKSLDWDYEKQDSKPMIEAFDKLISEADIVIGKNSDRFDNKHLNMHRMFNQQAPMPDWESATDDLEKQFRKHFGQSLPSQSLDYISKKLGLGGKIRMEMQDWVNIVEKTKDGLKSFYKMIKYGKKDVEDTRAIWMFAEKYISPKHHKVPTSKNLVCASCNSNRVHKRGVYEAADGSLVQRWYCLNHHGYTQREKK